MKPAAVAIAMVVAVSLLMPMTAPAQAAADEGRLALGDKWALGTDDASGLAKNKTLNTIISMGISSLKDQYGLDDLDVEMGQFTSVWGTFEVVGENGTAYLVDMKAAAQVAICLNVSSTMKYPLDGSYSAADLSRIQNLTYPGTVPITTDTAIVINGAAVGLVTLTVDKATLGISHASINVTAAFVANVDVEGMPDIRAQPAEGGMYDVSVSARNVSAVVSGAFSSHLEVDYDPGLMALANGSAHIFTDMTASGPVGGLLNVTGDEAALSSLPFELPDMPYDMSRNEAPGIYENGTLMERTISVDKEVPVTITITDGKISKIKYSPREILTPLITEGLDPAQAGAVKLVLPLIFSPVEIKSVTFAQAAAKVDAANRNLAAFAAQVTGDEPLEPASLYSAAYAEAGEAEQVPAAPQAESSNGLPWEYLAIGAAVLAALAVGVLLMARRGHKAA